MKILPVGIDIGTTAIRIAALRIDNGVPTLQHAHRESRERTDLDATAAQILRMMQALRMKDRRCISVLHDAQAVLRPATVVGIRKREAEAMATLEADRMYGEGGGHARVATIDGTNVVGLARKRALNDLRSILSLAGLKPIAIDHASLAYRRVFPHADALIDIGAYTTRFMALRGIVPWGTTIDLGGEHITEAIAATFGIDAESAEKRKIERRSAAGAAVQIDMLAEGVGRAIRSAKAAGFAEIERIVVCGNSARLPEFLEKIERDTGCIVELAARSAIDSGSFHPDVLAAAMPDWAIAIGAASWSIVEERAA